MDIRKATQVGSCGMATAAQMEKINALAKGKLDREQVYVFSLWLCDDQVDRDAERFDTGALPALARLFVGKTGVLDHQWSTQKQVARIFETQVVEEGNVHYIKAWAYIRRGGDKEAIIADIEAGIKKEVSVGCAMGRAVCSVCGGEYGSCGHRKGECYDGKTCCVILREPVDAYEFSFVAVPAQREAGVLKAYGGGGRLKDLAEEFGAQREYQTLAREAALGRRYQKELEDSVVRLGLALELGVKADVLKRLAQSAGSEDLLALQAALEERLQQTLPVVTQLGNLGKEEAMENGFLI